MKVAGDLARNGKHNDSFLVGWYVMPTGWSVMAFIGLCQPQSSLESASKVGEPMC